MNMPVGNFRPGFSAAMRRELEAVLAGDEFNHSPVLTKLLRYLVDETLSDRADLLKSYSVAVDGLGRSPDFDATTDSYPRVQLGRLRKALHGYYSRHGPAEELCLYLVLGSHRVRLGQMAAAYPDLYRPLSASAAPAEAPLVPSDTAAADVSRGGRILSLWMGLILALLTATLLAFVVGQRTGRQPPPPASNPATAMRSPILDLAPIQMDADPQSQRSGPLISAMLADGLGRSWVTQLRTSGTEPANGRAALPAGSLMAEVNGPFGAIAANPYDPLFMPTLAALSYPCGYHDAKMLLDRAYRLRAGGGANTDLLLTIAAIAQGRPDRVASFPQASEPADDQGALMYHLNMTLIDAAQGRTSEAVTHWARFAALSPPPRKSDEKMLAAIIMTPALRARVLAFMTEKKVIPG